MDIWLSFLFLFSQLFSADGLSCYSCISTSDKDDTCYKDNNRLIEDRIEQNGFVKNCTGPERVCLIEKITTTNALVFYMRDCSDDHTFSYKHERLQRIPINNASRCVFFNEHHICVTLCKGDFCNGPQGISVASLAFVNKNILYLILVALSMIFFFV